jgi:hypothetical protein
VVFAEGIASWLRSLISTGIADSLVSTGGALIGRASIGQALIRRASKVKKSAFRDSLVPVSSGIASNMAKKCSNSVFSSVYGQYIFSLL